MSLFVCSGLPSRSHAINFMLHLLVITVSSIILAVATSTSPPAVSTFTAPLVVTVLTDPLLVASPPLRASGSDRSTQPERRLVGSARPFVAAASPPPPGVSNLPSSLVVPTSVTSLVVTGSLVPLIVTATPSPRLGVALSGLSGNAGSTNELQALPPLARDSLCSAVDSYSDEIGIRVTPLLVRLASPSPPPNMVALNAVICTCHLYTSFFATSSTSCLPEKLHGLYHLLGLGLYAGTSFVKLSIKATTLQKSGLNFDSAIAFWRSFSMTSLLLITRFSVQECGIVLCDWFYVTVTFPTHYAVSIIDGSSQNLTHDPFIVAVTTVQECGYVSSSHYFATVASPSQYAVSSIDGSLQSQLFDSSTPFLVAGTSVQECRVASYNRFYASVAIPPHYAVSSVDGSSQSYPDDPLTGISIFNGGCPTPRSQNPLIGPFNVVLRTRALGLQVKLLYGSLLSLATSIPLYILVVFVYQFTVEVLSGCIQPCPLDL